MISQGARLRLEAVGSKSGKRGNARERGGGGHVRTAVGKEEVGALEAGECQQGKAPGVP
jgi:hypothetical protein